MAIGPGKYDDAAKMVRELTGGDLVVVIVANGRKGGGFSIQTTSTALLHAVPSILREVAADAQRDINQQMLARMCRTRSPR